MTNTPEIYECHCGHIEHRPSGSGVPSDWHNISNKKYRAIYICPSCNEGGLKQSQIWADRAPAQQPRPVRTGAFIQLLSGAKVDLANPDYSNVQITDIAAGLARTWRFNGQISQCYTVAHHCVIGCAIAAPAIRYDWLMHDAAEAVIGDVVSPLKSLLPDYQALEAKHERACFHRFDVKMKNKIAVKNVDRIMLAAELVVLRGFSTREAARHAELPEYLLQLDNIDNAAQLIRDALQSPRGFQWPFLEQFRKYAPAATKSKLLTGAKPKKLYDATLRMNEILGVAS